MQQFKSILDIQVNQERKILVERAKFFISTNRFELSKEIESEDSTILICKNGSDITLRLLGLFCPHKFLPIKVTFSIQNNGKCLIELESNMINFGSSWGLENKFNKAFDFLSASISGSLNSIDKLTDINFNTSKSNHSSEQNISHVNNYGLRGFAISFVIMFILTFKGCENGFKGSRGTDYLLLLIVSAIVGTIFGTFGLVIGRKIKSSKPLNDIFMLKQFFKSSFGKVVLFTLFIVIVLIYYFGRQMNPFFNSICLSDLRNNTECQNFLQGKWYFKKGSQYNYDLYSVEVNENKIVFKTKSSENQDWEVIESGEIGFSENIEGYWCCTRSVRAITINGTSTFLYVTQSEQYNDNCGGLAFDGYTGKDIVGDEDFFQRED